MKHYSSFYKYSIPILGIILPVAWRNIRETERHAAIEILHTQQLLLFLFLI